MSNGRRKRKRFSHKIWMSSGPPAGPPPTIQDMELALRRWEPISMKITQTPFRFDYCEEVDPSWLEYVASVSFKNAAIIVASIEIMRGTLTIRTVVRDRNDGLPLNVLHCHDLPSREMGLEFFKKWLREKLFEVYVHEFREAFHVDGVRVEDPHPPVTAQFVPVRFTL